MIIMTIFIVVAIFSFFVIVFGTNTYTQFDKFMERQQERGAVLIEAAATEVVNMTDNMKYLCIKMDANGSIDQIKDKEQQA